MSADLLWGLAIGAQIMACVGYYGMRRARARELHQIAYGPGSLYEAARECGVPSAMAWTAPSTADHPHAFSTIAT